MQWLGNRHAEGRKVAVIIGCKTGGVILRDHAWKDEIPAHQFKALIRSHGDLAEWITEELEA
jgi:hypothetical protein